MMIAPLTVLDWIPVTSKVGVVLATAIVAVAEEIEL